MHPRKIFVLFALAVMFAALGYSQAVNATLLGTVTDSSGAVIPNAKVTITDVNTGISRVATTNESGNYTFPDIAPGTYTVSTEQTGFKKENRTGVVVDVNSTARVDMRLQPGSISESIEVTGAAPALQTDRADTSSKIETVQTANLPVGTRRNYQSLLNLVPGTTRASFQHSQFFNAASSLQTEVNGQMRMGNNYQLEGIDNNERTGLLQILVPPIEAIQTVDVSTSNFEAELGRASGAVTNVMLKSGGNQVHGAAYEFLRNNNLNARSFFDTSVGALHYNYFGGNIGGPIKKNKIFFFADFLRITDHEANTNTLTIPTPTQISGDLSASTTTIYDPRTGNPDGTNRTPFPGNKITSGINPISAKLLALLPAPNQNLASGSNNYFALLPFHKDTNSYDGKIDYNLSDKDRLSVRLSRSRPEVFQAPVFGVIAGGPAAGNFEGTGIQTTYSAGINYTRVFSSTLVGEFRGGVAYYHNEAQNSDYGLNTSETLGIPGVNVGGPFFSGIVGINVGSFYSSNLIGYSASVPWVRAETNIDLANTWTKILGNHTIKFGGDLRRLRDDLLQDQTFSPRGVYTFGGGQTSLKTVDAAGKATQSGTSFYNNMAGFLLDLPNQAGRDLGQYFPAYRQTQLFFFVQDKWQVSSKLTVDLGLRWEFYKPGTPHFPGGFSNYNPTNNTLIIAGVGGNPEDLGLKARYKNFAPRFGLAYRLNDKTVVRLGFGISYTPFPDNTYAYNFPIRANNQFDPAINTYGPATLPDGRVATFQTGFPAPINPVIPANGILPVTGLLNNSSFVVINTDFKNPYTESFNLAIQRALPGHFTLDTAFVANHGVHSVATYNLNAALTAGGGNASLPQANFGRTAGTTLYFAGYSNIYTALQVKLNRRFATGLALTTSYTWGRGMGFQGGDDGGLMFYVNPRRSYARNDYDRTQTFVQSYVYDLPFGPGKKWLTSGLVGNIVGGWRITGITTLMTGTPFTIGGGGALNTPGSGQTASQVAPYEILHGINIGNPWFTPTAFKPETANGVFGNVGRNSITGPGFFNLDASIVKIIRYKERYTFELRGEAFGVTNTPQFNNPGTDSTSYNPDPSKNTFGVVRGAGGGRTLQLGLKLNF